MYDAISQFRDAIRATGLEPPDVIEPGKFHRFPGVGKRSGNTDGWCKLAEHGMGGCFGDWAVGFTEKWQPRREVPRSQTEKVQFKRWVEETQREVESKRQQQYAVAAEKAAAIWNVATPANDDHPYLVRKGVKANGARLHKGTLVIPVRSDSELCSLQFIDQEGGKRFLSGGRVKGGYYLIGTIKGAESLCIAEGFATGATIHRATGYPVAIAFNAGNLESVATAMHRKVPALPLIICADDDSTTEGNPGITKANLAALATGANVAIPDFGDERPDRVTDFNDMAGLAGLGVVAKAINTAAKPEQNGGTNTNDWPDPLLLMSKVEPEPYPLDALPDTLRNAVEEIHAFTKAPIPLVASSALATISLAVQAHVDVKRAEKLSGPVGLFLLTIADSGERKSTCDGFFMQVIRDFEARQAEEAEPQVKDFNATKEAWEAERGGIKDKIRSLAKSGKPTHEEKMRLRELEHNKPEPPRVPRLIYGDATPEALKWNLAKGWPSGGVVSSEAGLVFGAHGMNKESVMRNLAMLNLLWDGMDIATERRTTESFTLRGARLTIALQVQEATLRSFLDRSSGLARGMGFLARCLVAWPESTQGNRSFSDPPDTWPALAKFNQCIEAILNQDLPVGSDGVLSPPVIPLSVDAKAAWVVFHDTIESQLCSGGDLYDVRDVASKTADNAARIATLLDFLKHGICSAVGLASFEGASRVAAWHLHEARRFYGELALPKEQADAARLDSWLLGYCKREKISIISRREVQRNVSPIHLRQKSALDTALAELVESGRVRLIQEGRRKEIHINPVLLYGDLE